MPKVLVVDDNPDMAKLMARAIESEGYEAIVAVDGRLALHMARVYSPDAILLDVMMPRMGGIETLRCLKENAELSAIPVILVTAKADDRDIIAGLNAGAHDYITKPFKKEILAVRVRCAVGVKESHDRLQQVNEQLRTEIAQRECVNRRLTHAGELDSIGCLADDIAQEISTSAQIAGENIRFLKNALSNLRGLLDRFDRLLQAAKRQSITEELIAELEAALRAADANSLSAVIPNAIEQSLENINRVASLVQTPKGVPPSDSGQEQTIDLPVQAVPLSPQPLAG